MEKCVLVTGASRGIGRSIALKFLEEGYTVYGTYHKSSEKMEEIKLEYADKFNILGPYDFTDLGASKKLLDAIRNVYFDTIVCNAGMFSENDDFLDLNIDKFNEIMHCNFYTPMILCIGLKDRIKSHGSIVLMSSNDAYSGAYGSMSYSISKASLLSLNKCLCVNFGRRNIRVNSVAPGAINTDMNTPEQEFDAPLYTPTGRIGQPNEVAEVVYFLASNKASFINGENITIDGGYSDVSILLKNEVNKIRTFGGYKDIDDMYDSLREGDEVLHIDMCLPHAWDGSYEEREWLRKNYVALEHGASIKRIIVMNSINRDKIKQSKDMENFVNIDGKNCKTYIVKEEEVMQYCGLDYEHVGDGFGIFNESKAFIDSYSDRDSIGYYLDGETIVLPLVQAFNNIWSKLENNTIAKYNPWEEEM